MTDDSKATANTSDEAANKTVPATATATGTQTAKTEDAQPKFTQADQDALAAKVRREEKEKFDRQQEKVKREAEEAKAKEQGEFQKLADSYKKELDEVKPLAEQLDSYKSAVATLAKGELEALPEEVREMSPSLDSPLEVLAWLPKGKKLAERLTGTGKRGNSGDPRPVGATSDQALAQAKQSLRAGGRYTL